MLQENHYYPPVADLPENYNSESGYEYTATDLVARHNLKGTSLGGIVGGLEATGNAAPIASETAYREYVKKWGTDKSFYHAIEGGYFGNLLPGTTGALSHGQNSLAKSVNTSTSFNPQFGKVGSPIQNGWNRFQHANKGSGKSIQQLAKEYNRLIKGK